VLRDEWRSRRSVSIPVLRPDFVLHIEDGSGQLRQTKGAADIAVYPYTKSHGTKGVAVYFFDGALQADKRERLRRFVSLYGAFAFDSPDSSRLVLHHGVGAMEQGIAMWNGATRALLYSNGAYRRMFGRNNTRTISDVLGKDIRGRVTRETISDGRGRYFDVTHTACGNRGQGVISTIIIDNTAYVKAQRRLDAMARTDALTGLYNRRAGLEYLVRMYALCREQKKPLTVCFADIDGLKHINDTWGHGAGDAMIQSVSAVIRKYVADLGTVCRLGGDEFVVILPGMTLQATLLAAQISREAGQCFVEETDGVTLSFGFKQAEFVAGETADTLISVADMEMYREKNRKSR
jgi:diguanylate cyclase (GGDEF)-like protein